MKVLLSFVGEQDPFSTSTNEEGSIVTLSRNTRPDNVLLIATTNRPDSKSNMEEYVQLTEDWLVKEVGMNSKNIYIRLLDIDDPTDYAKLLEYGKIVITNFLSSLPENAVIELIINTSSGTPQMKACWYIWSNAGLFAPSIPMLYQVLNPRYAMENERVRRVSCDFMEENNLIIRIQEYFKKNMFFVTSEESKKLASVSAYSDRRDKAEILMKISLAYHHWDLLDYNEAIKILRSIIAKYDGAKDMETVIVLLRKQLDVLKELLTNNHESITGLIDIYYNAKRRLGLCAYSDVLARIWRLIEGTLYFHLRTKHGVEPLDLRMGRNEENKNIARAALAIQYDKKISFQCSRKLMLDVFSDGKYIQFENSVRNFSWENSFRKMRLSDAIDNLRSLRNESIVAHGMKPVSQNIAKLALEVGEEILKYSCDDENIRTYPFQTENHLIFSELLKR